MVESRPDPVFSPWQKTILDEVIAVLRRTSGLDVSCYEESFLLRCLEKRQQVTGSRTPEAYIKRLATYGGERDALSQTIHVIYSDFFRDTLGFAQLEQLILPSLLNEKEKADRSEIRVWSVACAAGQEAWSVALLLDELIGAENQPVSCRIFASDRSEPDLMTAHRGVYSADALKNVRLRHLDNGFTQEGESFAIAPRVRARVDFSLYNLLDPATTSPPASVYGDFDLILCCNVLLYYRPEVRRFILDKLRHCLAPGGFLMTGEAERQLVESAGGFRAVASPATVFHRLIQIG